MESKYESPKKLALFYKKIKSRHVNLKENSSDDYLKECSSKLEKAEKQLKALVGTKEKGKFTEIINYINGKKKEFDYLYDDLNKVISVYIIGDDNLGKSTLTKALLASNGFQLGNNVIDIYSLKNDSDDEVKIIRSGREPIELQPDEAFEYLNNIKRNNDESRALIERNYIRKHSKYENDENALRELKVEYDKELFNLTNDIREVIWPIKDSEILKKFAIADTQELPSFSSNMYYKCDCALFIINAKELYFQEKPVLLDYVKNKKVIGIINNIDEILDTTGEIGISRLMKDSKKIYGNKLRTVVPISAKAALAGILEGDHELVNESGIKKLEQLMDYYFLKNVRDIKINAKKEGADILISELTRNIKKFTNELKDRDNDRSTLRYDFREVMSKETSVLKAKVDWFLNTHEMNIKNSIETKSSVLFETHNDLYQYAKKYIFNIEEFIKELARLKEDVVILMEKFYDKNLFEYRFKKFKHLLEEDIRLSEDEYTSPSYSNTAGDIDFLSHLDITKLKALDLEDIKIPLEEIIGKKNFMMTFTKKKKISNLQIELVKILESLMNLIKNELYSGIDDNMHEIYIHVYKNIEDSFVDLYCSTTSVNKSIRILDNLKRDLILPESKVSVKDIIIGKRKLSR